MRRTKTAVRSKITSKAQVTIPKEIREGLGVRSGDTIEWVSSPAGWTVRRCVDIDRVRKWRGYLKDLAGKPSDDVVREMRGD